MTTQTQYDLAPANQPEFELTVTQVPMNSVSISGRSTLALSAVANPGAAYFCLDGPLLCDLQRWYLVVLHLSNGDTAVMRKWFCLMER
jgi:hypothetical protein